MTKKKGGGQVAGQPSTPAYELDEAGRYHALLPSGKRPVIVPLHPRKLRRIYETFPYPQPPDIKLEVEGTGMAQKVHNKNDPAYKEKLATWYIDLQSALLTRFLVDALVIPEDADFVMAEKHLMAMPTCKEHHEYGYKERWLRMGWTDKALAVVELSESCTCVPCEDDWSETLRAIQVPVPKTGPDRQWAYVEERLDSLLGDPDDQSVFIEAVRQLSIPTEAGIAEARRRFRDEVARHNAD